MPVLILAVRPYTSNYPYFDDFEMRCDRAVFGYLNGMKLHDCTGDIQFYFTGPGADNSDNILLFTHQESTAYLLPLIEEE